MTPEEACEEALRRIRKAEETGAVALDLRGLKTLNRLPPEFERLTLLQSLNLRACTQLSDLIPLKSLTSLQELDLGHCEQLSGDLTPLARFTSLRRLDLSSCGLSGDLSPLSRLTLVNDRLGFSAAGNLIVLMIVALAEENLS